MEAVVERRACPRSAPSATGWAPNATLRPGLEITIVNVTAGGLLIRALTRVLPGKRVDIQLLGQSGRHCAVGRVLRSRVVALSPICYEAAIALDEECRIASDRAL